MSQSILIALGEEKLRRLVKEHLEEDGHDPVLLPTEEPIIRFLQDRSFDLVLTDLEVPRISAGHFIHKLGELAGDCEVVFIVPFRSVGEATLAMKEGAFGFITKPVHWGELRLAVSRALERGRMRREVQGLRSELRGRYGQARLIGSSPAIWSIRRWIDRALASTFPALIEGERGTGKRLVAKILHYGGVQAKGPFLSVDCASLPPELLETHLRGVSRGALPGVERHRPGTIEDAHGGTLFLEAIHKLELPLQEKLLEILDTGQVFPLGSRTPIRVDFRLVVSTHRPLRALLESGGLLPAFHRRLLDLAITLPSLRERPEDFGEIVRDLLQRYGASEVRLPRETLDWLQSHTWPGNFPELEYAVERALLFRADPGSLKRADFHPHLSSPPRLGAILPKGDEMPAPPAIDAEREWKPPAAEPDGTIAAGAPRLEPTFDTVERSSGSEVSPTQSHTQAHPQPPAESRGPSPDPETSHDPYELPPKGVDLVDLERTLIQEALERTDGNQTKAARLLGLSRQTLIYRMQKHGIER